MREVLPAYLEEVRESVADRRRRAEQTDRVVRMLPAVLLPRGFVSGDRLKHRSAAANQVLLFEQVEVRLPCVHDSSSPIGAQPPGQFPPLRRFEFPQPVDQVVDVGSHRVSPPSAYSTR
jgi:hypothetical protein